MNVVVELVPPKDWYTDVLPACAHVGNVCEGTVTLRFMRIDGEKHTENIDAIAYACPIHTHEVAKLLL